MTVVRPLHERFNAVFEDVGDRAIPAHYGRPERTVRAVRNGVGVTEARYGVLAVTGEDRVAFVDNAVSNRVPATDGEGCYALLLDPQGAIRADLYVYAAADRLLVFTPPAVAEEIATEWAERTFVQDVAIADASADLGVFGVHGPNATEKVASVLNRAATPEDRLSFARGKIADQGVTVIRTDAPTGEEGYEVVVSADDAEPVFDALVSHGLNAVPFGTRAWELLTLEAGTPLFDTELAGELPNVLGLRNALDFEKGCYVGQEVVSRVENRGRPSRRLVGLSLDADAPVPDAGDEVVDGDGAAAGELTRAVDSPTIETPIAFGLVDSRTNQLLIENESGPTCVRIINVPFVYGSEESARSPSFN